MNAPNQPKMKPMIILPPDEMSPDDIQRLRDNDICVVVTKHPQSVKFVDPIPVQTSRTQIEHAAIMLTRKLFSGALFRDNKRDFANLYVECLIAGTPLDGNGTAEEQEQRIFDAAKRSELERLAREEATAERAAKKAKKDSPAP